MAISGQLWPVDRSSFFYCEILLSFEIPKRHLVSTEAFRSSWSILRADRGVELPLLCLFLVVYTHRLYFCNNVLSIWNLGTTHYYKSQKLNNLSSAWGTLTGPIEVIRDVGAALGISILFPLLDLRLVPRILLAENSVGLPFPFWRGQNLKKSVSCIPTGPSGFLELVHCLAQALQDQHSVH